MADVELLPLPLTLRHPSDKDLADHVQSYARACVEANLAPLQAENERLRAEVEDYRTNGAAAVRFAPNSAHWSNELRRLFGDDARAGIEVLENWHLQELARAERLAEALRDAEKSLRTIANRAGGTEYLMTIGDVRGYANSRANEARAALAQEDRND